MTLKQEEESAIFVDFQNFKENLKRYFALLRIRKNKRKTKKTKKRKNEKTKKVKNNLKVNCERYVNIFF